MVLAVDGLAAAVASRGRGQYKRAPGGFGVLGTKSGNVKSMRIISALAAALLLASCGSDDTMDETETGSTAITSQAGGHITMGVNSFLWHATLDTLSFMPLRSADPFGGTIITDWYSSPNAPNDRMRVTAYILDRRLRADGLKITVFRQTQAGQGWVDAAVNPETAIKLEDAILTRARELKLASGAGS